MHNKRSGKIESHFFETHKNSVMKHGSHVHKTVPDVFMETMCPFLSDKIALPHWKCVLYCCEKCPSIVVPGQ